MEIIGGVRVLKTTNQFTCCHCGTHFKEKPHWTKTRKPLGVYEICNDCWRDFEMPFKDKRHAYIKRSRRIKSTADGSVTTTFTNALKIADQKCPCCGVTLTNENRHLSHVIPLAIGGAHQARNLRYFCKRCNSTQCSKHPLQWLRDRPRLAFALLKKPLGLKDSQYVIVEMCDNLLKRLNT